MTRSPHYGTKCDKVCRQCGNSFTVLYKKRTQFLCSRACSKLYLTPPSINDLLDDLSIPEPNSGCLLWLGPATEQNYGRFGHTYAHRASYERWKGKIPKSLFVCHRCDNTWCINPDHLFLGTAKDNTQDAVSKGRMRNGGGYAGRIPDTAIALFRSALQDGVDTKTAALGAGFSPSHGSRVARGLRRARIIRPVAAA